MSLISAGSISLDSTFNVATATVPVWYAMYNKLEDINIESKHLLTTSKKLIFYSLSIRMTKFAKILSSLHLPRSAWQVARVKDD